LKCIDPDPYKGLHHEQGL